MDLHILNNPNLLPPDQVRIERVAAQPSADGRRVQVQIRVTPFRERPNLEIQIVRDGQRVASASAVAIMNVTAAFNLHLRGIADPSGDYAVDVALYYDDLEHPQDRTTVDLRIPAPGVGS